MKHLHQSWRGTATPSPEGSAATAPAIGIGRTHMARIVKLCPTNVTNRRTGVLRVGQVPTSDHGVMGDPDPSTPPDTVRRRSEERAVAYKLRDLARDGREHVQ